MDTFGAKDKKDSKHKLKYKSHSTFFHSPSRQREFVVDPEWVSEGIHSDIKDQPDSSSLRRVQSMKERTSTFPPRRGRGSEPITWRYWPTKDNSRMVLQTNKVDFNNHHVHFGPGSSYNKQRRNTCQGTFFASACCFKKPYYTIDPEWASESIKSNDSTKNQPKDDSPDGVVSSDAYRKRCNSAPPPKCRNPITWENT